jgi:hypothetical protein
MSRAIERPGRKFRTEIGCIKVRSFGRRPWLLVHDVDSCGYGSKELEAAFQMIPAAICAAWLFFVALRLSERCLERRRFYLDSSLSALSAAGSRFSMSFRHITPPMST